MSNSDSRRGFLKTLLAGIAAAPLVGSSLGSETPTPVFGGATKSSGVDVKKWEHGGVNFAEWTFPVTVPPMFENEDPNNTLATQGFKGNGMVKRASDAKSRWADPSDTHDLGPRYASPRRIIIPLFNQNTIGASFDTLVEKTIESYEGVDVVKRYGGKPSNFDPTRLKPTHFLIVKVHGRPELLGLSAMAESVVPVTDYYRGL